jgi:hypothetical protein
MLKRCLGCCKFRPCPRSVIFWTRSPSNSSLEYLSGYTRRCEVAAAKRWLSAHAQQFAGQPVRLLGDDLYSHQPMVEQCLAMVISFIFTCLPDSHRALYDWLNYLEGIGEVKTLETRQWHKRSQEIYHYRYVNQIPIRDTQPASLHRPRPDQRRAYYVRGKVAGRKFYYTMNRAADQGENRGIPVQQAAREFTFETVWFTTKI